MKRLTFIVIAAALLWAGFWAWSASAQKTAIANWFDARRAEGWAADYSDLQIFGFPNRLDTTLTAPRLGDPESGLFWEAPFLQFFRFTYNPAHLITVWPNTQSFATPDEAITLTTADMRASLEMADVSRWQPQRVILVTEGLNVASDANWDLTADVMQLSLQQSETGDAIYQLALDVRGVKGALPGWINITGQDGNQPPIERLTADIDLTLSAPLDRSAVENARPQPVALRLNLADARWSGLTLAAAGDLDITPSGTPVGQITVKVRNWRDMLAKERKSGRLSPRVLDQIDFTLTLISGLSGNPSTLDLPFDFTNGKIWLGPLMLGDAPRISLP